MPRTFAVRLLGSVLCGGIRGSRLDGEPASTRQEAVEETIINRIETAALSHEVSARGSALQRGPEPTFQDLAKASQREEIRRLSKIKECMLALVQDLTSLDSLSSGS